MRLRGPARHLTGLGRAAFLAYRHSLVTEAFISRRTTFLAAQPWLDLSRSIQSSLLPVDRTAISELVSDFHLLIVEIPGLVSSLTDPTSSIQSKQKLLTSGLACRGNLHVWRERLTTTLEETDQQVTTHVSTLPDLTFPQAYRFPTLAIGSLLCGYWAVSTILNRSLALLESGLASPAEGSTAGAVDGGSPSRYRLRNAPEDSQDYVEENLSNARASCMAVEGLSTNAFLGPTYLIFALRVAWWTFEAGGMEREWVLEKLEGLGEYLGIARRGLDDEREMGGGEGLGEEDRRGSTSGQSGIGSVGASLNQHQSVGASHSGAASPDVSRRPSLLQQQQQQQQQGLSREVSREGSGMGVSLQEIEIERGDSRRGSRQEEKGKGKRTERETGMGREAGTGRETGTGKGKGKGVVR